MRLHGERLGEGRGWVRRAGADTPAANPLAPHPASPRFAGRGEEAAVFNGALHDRTTPFVANVFLNVSSARESAGCGGRLTNFPRGPSVFSLPSWNTRSPRDSVKRGSPSTFL